MTNNTEPTIITNIDETKRRQLALVTLKARLKLELKSGLRASSRGPSTMMSCRSWGYRGPKDKAKAIAWCEEELAK